MTTSTVFQDLRELAPPEAINLAGRSDEDLGRRHLSHSSLNAQLACQQLYAYLYVERIAPRATGAPRRMGGAFAKGLEAGDPEVAIADVIDRAIILSQADEDQARVEGMIVGSAVKAYLAAYGEEVLGGREFGYRVRLRNPETGAYSRTFDLLGYADQLIARGEEEFEMIEDKLVGAIQPVMVKRLPLDRQHALSCYGIWRATGKPVTKIRHRFTRKPSIKQKKDESLEAYLERIEADYTERPDFYLHEEVLERDIMDLARTEAELWQWAEHRRAAERQHVFPRNSSHCSDYGGCPFIPLCCGDPDAVHLYGPKPDSDRGRS